MSELFIPSLHIVNYRAFRDLHITHLGRVNLFVGRNNIGKTSLLEAIWLYSRRGASSVIREILAGRDESRLPLTTDLEEVPDSSISLRYLFFGRPLKVLPGTSLQVGPDNGSNLLSMTVQAYRFERDINESVHRRVIVTPEQYDLEEEVRLGLTVQFGDQTLPFRELGQIFGRRSPVSVTDSNENAAIMVPAGGPNRSQIAAWRDRSIIEGKKQYVLRALKLIAPEVEDVDLVSGTSLDLRTREPERIPVVKLRDIDEFIALRSLGDGMNRMFTLALALVNAQDGVLLIDEIENGLHYSVQSEMWRLVIRIATEINAQVFATTHSKDCVDAFSKTINTHPEEGVLIRLGYKNGDVIATIFDEEELEAVTDQDIEVR